MAIPNEKRKRCRSGSEIIKPRGSEELCNTDADPQELKNLIADPKYAGYLASRALDQQCDTGDTVPALDRRMGLTGRRGSAAGEDRCDGKIVRKSRLGR